MKTICGRMIVPSDPNDYIGDLKNKTIFTGVRVVSFVNRFEL